MENNYRDMMDAVKAPEGLRMEVMNMSEQERTKKTRPLPVRVALAAACIGALLMTAAVAEVAGFDFVRIFTGRESERGDYQYDGYRVDGSGVKNIPVFAFSQAVQDLEEQYKDAGGHTEYLTFDSWEEAEEYLGYEIFDHPMLQGADYIPVWRQYTETGMTITGNCVVEICIGQYGVSMIRVTSNIRRPPGMHHGFSVTADLYVGDPLLDETETSGYTYGFNSDLFTMEGEESYLTANELETVIIGTKNVPDKFPSGFAGNGKYHAHFFLRGIRFNVETGYRAEDQATALPELKEILDAFE